MATIGDALSDDGLSTSLIGTEQGSDPAAPAAGQRRLYPKADGWYDEDAAGTVTGPLGTGSVGGGSTVGAGASKSGTQSVAQSTDVTVNWDTEDFDEGGLLDIATSASRFTIPSGGDGIYQVSAAVAFSVTADQATTQLKIHVNGAEVARNIRRTSGTADGLASISKALNLAAGDYVQIVCRQTSDGSTPNIGGAVIDNYCTVVRAG